MKFKMRSFLYSLLALTCCISGFNIARAQESSNIIENSLQTPIEKKNLSSTIKSELESLETDFYFLNNGLRKKYHRSKDLFLIIHKKDNTVTTTELSSFIASNFTDNVEVIKDHSFSGHTLVRVSPESIFAKESLISSLQTSDSSVDYVSPVFSAEKTKANNVAIMPGIVVKLKNGIDPIKLTNETSLGANLVMVSALKDARQEFEYRIKNQIADAGEIFTLSRKIMDLPYVKWAEPLMLTSPFSLFMPNDALYGNQWHLHNTGQNGGVIDADIDAPEGWELSTGDGTVVAIYDDGVQVNHPDLSNWSNPGETGNGKETNGLDDDGNGYIDDFQGWDFVDADNDPSPSASTDNHGTAVAGVAAAKGNNALGVAGSAIDADILPIRSGSMTCVDFGNAMRYAGKYADVVNNSWSISACESELNSAINDVVSGNIVGSKRGAKGTPVLYASGNSASGWIRFSVPDFTAGTYDFRWEFAKDIIISEGYDTVWLDDITWPGGTNSDFEGETLGGLPSGFTGSGNANWSVINDGTHARGATGKSVKAGTITHNQVTQLDITKTVGTGTLYYWALVSSELNFDFFNFYVNGSLYHQYAPGQYSGHTNEVGYPASNPNTIAVGASQDGGPGDVEERTYYSQFGPEVDVVAPTSGGFQGVTTTDRTGADGYDNTSDYTSSFGGTSSATPLTSGVVADLISFNPDLTALQVRDVLRAGADQIGPYNYPNDRNDYYGHGRVNLLKTLQLSNPVGQKEGIKRAELAKPLLQVKYGYDYAPPVPNGIFTDVATTDFNADWIEKLSVDEFTEGCSATKFCPDMVVTKEQLAKILLKAKLGSAYIPPAATGTVYSDVGVGSAGSVESWIEDLDTRGYSDGCDTSKFCPNEVISKEAFLKMMNKVLP